MNASKRGKQREEYRRKAEEVAESIRWLAEGNGPDSPEIRRVIDRAHAVVATFRESITRNSIIARIAFMAAAGSDGDDPERLREWIAVQSTDPLNRVKPDASKVDDETIRAAITAWRRDRSARGGETKWEAALKLLQACGLAENVTGDALRKGWQRRHG